MSSTRPKLVQEGAPLGGNSSSLLSSVSASAGSSSLQAVSTQSKSKFRLVIGGEDEDKPLPDDPDQQHAYSSNYENNSYRGGGRGGGRGGSGGRRLNYNYNSGGGGRGGYNNKSYRGGGRGGYRGGGGGGRDYNNHHYRGGGGGGGGYNDHHDQQHGGSRYDAGYENRYDNNNYGSDYHHHDNNYDHRYNDNNGPHRKVIKNPKAPGLINSRIVIGNDAGEEHPPEQHYGDNNAGGISMEVEDIIPQTYNEELHQIERMEGVVSLDAKEPLVVMDGANVAYAYADAMAAASSGGGGKREPDYRGLQVAANHFMSAGVRVLIVLPAPWFRVKPRAGDTNRDNALMLTERVEALKILKEQGLLVAAPPRDDDDAYALTIARRENMRAMQRGEGGGFVLSNDMFRDAMARDAELEQWLKGGWGRISFAFCDLGTSNDYGQRELDFIPNPRHPLVSDVDRQRHAAAAAALQPEP